MAPYLKRTPSSWKMLGSGRSLVSSSDIIVQKAIVDLRKRQGGDFVEGPASPEEPIPALKSAGEALIEVGYGTHARYYYVNGVGTGHTVYACDVTHVVDEINHEALGDGWREQSDGRALCRR